MAEIVSFGSWVEKRRKYLGLTRRALAAQIGCSPVTIQKIERDERRPSVQIARLLAQKLQIPEKGHDNFIGRARGGFVADFPAPDSSELRSSSQNGIPPRNLPRDRTPFIGRVAELASLQALIEQADKKFISIVGTGGMGKTRLATALARQLLQDGQKSSYPHGIFFASLASLSDASLIPLAVAEAIGFTLEGSGQPQRNATQQLLDYLRDKRLLLILDNFEHLLEGVDFVIELLETAADVKLLITTRERLNLREEQLFPLAGLSFPDQAEAFAEPGIYTAIELFLQAARRVRPDFSIHAAEQNHLAHICRLVEGMPLGLELAAGWVDTLPLAEIANEIQRSSDFLKTELRDMPKRHRNMQVVFAYSWDQLSEAEQIQFAQLSIFRGGFDFRAAQAITGATLTTLQFLVGKSFVGFDQSQGRFQIHELLRQFGAGKLAGMPALIDEVTGKYCRFYCKLAASLLADLTGAHQAQALETLEQDLGNVSQAWDFALERDELALLVQAADAIGYYHEWRGQYEAGLDRFATAANAIPSVNDEPAQRMLVKMLTWQATFLQILGELQQAEVLLQRCLVLLSNNQALNLDVRGEKAAVLLRLGMGQSAPVIHAEAIEILEQSRMLFEASGDKWGLARALEEMGRSQTYIFTNPAAVDRLLSGSLVLHRELGNQRSIAHLLGWLALSASYQGKFELAEAFGHECLQICRQLGGRTNLAYGLECYGMMLGHLGRFPAALKLLEEALTHYLDLGNKLQGRFTRNNFAQILLYAGQVQQAKTEYGLRVKELPNLPAYPESQAYTLARLAELESYEKRYEQALAHADQGATLWSQSRGQNSIIGPLVYASLGRAQHDVGDINAATQNLATALKLLLNGRHFLALAQYVMPNVALTLAAQGEPEQALTIDAMLTSRYPPYRLSEYFAKAFHDPILVESAALPASVIKSIQQQRLPTSPWKLAAETLDMIIGLGWAESSS